MCDKLTRPDKDAASLADYVEVGSWPSFAAICNAGRSHAGGEYILFLNDDVVMLNDVVHLLACWMDTHWETGCVGPRVLDRQLTPTTAWGTFPFLVGGCLRFVGLTRFVGRSGERTKRVPYVTGACFMVRANDGLLFDEEFIPAYWEEVDYCLRLKMKGQASTYFRWAIIIHYGSHYWQRNGKDAHVAENLWRFLLKHRPRRAKLYYLLYTRFGTK